MYKKLKSSLLFTFLVTLSIILPIFNTKAQEINEFPIKQTVDEKIQVNCIFSVGQYCRAAYQIQKNGKRFQSSPLDWIKDYSLDTCLHLFQTKFSDFFEFIKEDGCCEGNRRVWDTKNHILSIHYFPINAPLQEEHVKFRKIMLNRANKVDKILSDSESIALVMHQDYMPSEEETNKQIDFLKKFSEIYPGKKIYFINVVCDNIKDMKRELVFENENLQLIRFSFYDMHEEKHFSGNHEGWKRIMNCIELKRNT